ncbi:MAG: hypothetical protein ABIK92_11660 [Pseudomonadota bacterium]
MSLKKYYLMLQLGSFEKSAKVLNLFEFPIIKILPEKYDIVSYVWSQGNKRKKSHKDFNKFQSFISKLKDETFNTITINATFDRHLINNYNIEIHSMSFDLLVSPLNILWGNVYGYRVNKLKLEKIRASFESKERSLRWNEVSKYPSLFVTVIEMNSDLNINKLKEESANLISLILDKNIEELDFGCIDLLDSPPMLDMLQNLAPYPKTYQYLDEQFDEMHDFLIGKNDLCRALFDRLTKSKNISIDRLTDKCSILSLYERDENLISEINEYFVKKDQSTAAYKMKPENGEYRIESRLFFTRRRYKELVKNKMLPTINAEEFSYFQILSDKFLTKINVYPDDVLVTPSQKVIFEGFYSEVDYNYEKLTDVKNERQRIWIAHEKTYTNPKYSIAKEKIIKKIKELYFNDI